MDVLTLLATLRRRWIIVGTVVGLSVAVVAAMVLMIERPYRMEGSYLVGTESLTRPGERELPEEDGEQAAAGDRQRNADAGVPEDAEQPDDVEPGESGESDGGQTIVPGVNSAAIGEAVQDGATVEQLREQGADANYTVNAEDNLLRVIATSSSREGVVPTVVGVLDAIRSEVAQRQAGDAPDDEQIAVETLAVPTDASVRVKELDGGEQEFSAFGTVRLVRPSDLEIFNPYESFGFSMRVVEEVLLGDQGEARIVEAGGAPEPQGEDDPGYVIHYDERDPAPVAYLSATGTEPERVERTFRAIVEVANQELDMRQAALGVDSEGRTGLQELSVFDVPEPASRELARAAITVLGIGAVTAVGLALLVDNVAYGLQRHRDEASDETDETDETYETDEPLRSSGAAAPADTDTPPPNRDEATDESPGPLVAAAPADTDTPPPNGEAMPPPPVVDQEEPTSPGTRSADTDTPSPNRDEATDESPGPLVAAAPADTDTPSPNGEEATDESPGSLVAAALADTDTPPPNREEATDESPGPLVAAAPADTDTPPPNGEATPPPNGEATPPPNVDQEEPTSPGTRPADTDTPPPNGEATPPPNVDQEEPTSPGTRPSS